MIRTLVFIALATLLVGCTRYGTNPQGGPFARKPKASANPYVAIPPGPPATSSPLALGTAPPAVLPTPGPFTAVPPRPPEPVALGNGFRGPQSKPGDVIPASGTLDPNDSLVAIPPLLPRRKTDPTQMPSPFAPKGPLAPGPMPAATPASPMSAALHIAEVKKLAAAATERYAKVESYEATVSRRELTPSKEMMEDTVIYQYRKEPVGVFIKNISESGKGREILYSPGKHGDKIYAVIGKGDENFLYKVGQKAMPVSPDFPIVKSKSRYSIREAGYGTPIARVGAWAAKAESGKIPAENLVSLGSVVRKEFPYPLLGVQLKLRPGDDPLMPNGGMRQWFFDPNLDSTSYAFPVIIIATEPNGKEVEYYLFEKMKLNVKFTDADFDPARMGKK